MIELKGIRQTCQGSNGSVEAPRGVDLRIKPGEVHELIKIRNDLEVEAVKFR